MSYLKSLKETIIGDEDNVKVRMNAAGGVVMRYDENNRKQILLLQRARKDHWPNFWEFPRGKCDKPIGESLVKCVQREIKEETGLDVEPLILIDTFNYLADKGTRKTICHNFLCRMKDPEQKIKLSKEHQDFKWVSELGEIELLLLPEQKKTIEKVLNSDRSIVSYPNNKFTKNNNLDEYLQNLCRKVRKINGNFKSERKRPSN